MAKQVKAFEANDGSLHRKKELAAERDVVIIVGEILGKIGSDLRPEHFTQFALERREDLIRVLTEYHRVAPIQSKASAPQNKQEGPVSKDPYPAGMISVQDFSGTVTKIPAGVFWNEELSGFYRCSGEACGEGFYDEWSRLKGIFPKLRSDARDALSRGEKEVLDFRSKA